MSARAGHPRSRPGPGHGGSEHPGFNLEVNDAGPAAERRAETLAAKLRGPDTKVETLYWRGPGGGEVTHANGKLLNGFSREKVDKYPTQHAMVEVDSTLRAGRDSQARIRRWWDAVLSRAQTPDGVG